MGERIENQKSVGFLQGLAIVVGMIMVLLILTYVPPIVTFLPTGLGY